MAKALCFVKSKTALNDYKRLAQSTQNLLHMKWSQQSSMLKLFEIVCLFLCTIEFICFCFVCALQESRSKECLPRHNWWWGRLGRNGGHDSCKVSVDLFSTLSGSWRFSHYQGYLQDRRGKKCTSILLHNYTIKHFTLQIAELLTWMLDAQKWFSTGKVGPLLKAICVEEYGTSRQFLFPAETRFAGKLLQIKRFHDMKSALKLLVSKFSLLVRTCV